MRSSHEKGIGFFGVFNIIVCASILVAGLVSFVQLTNTNPFSASFLESDPPQISWVEEPLGIGADPIKVKALVADDGAGLDEVIVRVSQNNQAVDTFKQSTGKGNADSQDVEFLIDPKKLNLREGSAELQITAFDRALWNNGASLVKSLQVDFLKPRIEVITPEQNAVLGGTELVFFKALGRSITVQGIESGGSLYPGFPARAWDDSFKSYERVFFAFFPVPPDFTEERSRMKIIVRDSIGNSASAPFKYRIRPKRWSSFKVSLTEASAVTLRERLIGSSRNVSINVALPGDLSSDLQALFKDLARYDEAQLDDALSASDSKRWWSGAFTRPVNAAPAHAFGDQGSVVLANKEILNLRAQGIRFPVQTRSNVVASQAGRVVLVEDLGLLGTTVVVDHGCGLASVYGHLSETSVREGAEVTKGQPIGRTGSSGFAVSEELYFEMRVQGVPVSANEWWDEVWVKDHIQNKVDFVQRALVGASAE